MKKKAKLIGILAVATLAVGGTAWLSANGGPPVGEGKTIHVLAQPT
jgi:hypothetical protein